MTAAPLRETRAADPNRRRVRASAQLTPLGERVAKVLRRTGLTQEQFAGRAGVNRRTLYRLLRGTQKHFWQSSVALVEAELQKLEQT